MTAPTEKPKKYTLEESAALRDALLQQHALPAARRAFERYSLLESAVVVVAQFWNDEARDAVHCELLYSLHQNPSFADYQVRAPRDEVEDDPLDPGGYVHCSWDTLLEGPESGLHKTHDYYSFLTAMWGWPDNGEAIPAFAAFCAEGGSQLSHLADAYTPYAILRRAGDDVTVEVVGLMLRPWLDGITPEWELPLR